MIVITGGKFKVHAKSGVIECWPNRTRLHYPDLSISKENEAMMVTIARDNYEDYTNEPMNY